MIDRLLASPAYGERWGRHWLDNAGYADTHGGDNDLGTIKENKNIWKYRDYVIRSLNADKPFDRFITEQLAGDEASRVAERSGPIRPRRSMRWWRPAFCGMFPTIRTRPS